MKIVAVEPIGITAERAESIKQELAAKGHEFVWYPDRKEDPAVLVERMKDAEVAIISNIPLAADVLSQCGPVPLPAGSTIKRIAEKAYLMQDETWVTRRTPKPIEDAHPHYHYVYGFGDKGLDVSVQYGVTIAYSDIEDADAGFHLRYLYIGNDVDLP